MKKTANPKVKTLPALKAFEQGLHREVVDRVQYPHCSSEELAALIGSLSFLGRIEEATELWTLGAKKLSAPLKARARFALALACTRVSKFKSARRWLKGNLTDIQTKSLPETSQGLGVYFYYLGQFDKAALHSRRALRRALKLNDFYIRAFATDLYGHALVQTGRRAAGLRVLGEARDLAKREGKGDVFDTTILLYEAEAGHRPLTIVAELEKRINELDFEDSFTRSNLILELARQLTLRGQWQKARERLDQDSTLIYAFENRRQEATLQLRLAEISYRQGDAAGAWHFLQGARRCLNKIADNIFELRILGLEAKVERDLLRRAPSKESTERFQGLSQSHPNTTNAKILGRLASISARKSTLNLRSTDDPLGDTLDRIAVDPVSGAQELLKKGYLGLWPQANGLTPGSEKFVLFEDGNWIAVHREGVSRSEQPLSNHSKRILELLSLGPANKEKLIKGVWGYAYDSLRHDPMLYAALASLRKSLGPASRWVVTLDEGWSANTIELETPLSAKALKAAPQIETIAVELSDLNWRQSKALREMATHPAWTVSDHKTLFDISTMTAWRDLDELAKKGHILRRGRGRLTTYHKRTST